MIAAALPGDRWPGNEEPELSEYLSDEEQVARLRSWWADNGLWLVGAVLLAIAVAVGWRWYQADRAQTMALGSTLYEEFGTAEPAVQASLADELADKAAGTAYPALARLALASAAMSAEPADPAAAKTELEAALALANDDALADLARLRLARVEMQLDDREAALAALQGVRTSGYRSMVAELKGDIHMAAGETTQAHEAYQSALDSLEADDRRPVLELKAGTTAAELSGRAPVTVEAPATDTPDDAAPADAAPGDAPESEGDS